jgi:hypothetical protein
VLHHAMAASRWAKTIGALAVPAAIGASAIGLAAPAGADGGTYLQTLAPRYTSLSESQLMSAGQSVCAATGRGMPASTIVPMLVKNYGVSVSTGYEITVAAINHLGC